MISRYSIAHESLFPNMKLSVAQEQTITSRDWGLISIQSKSATGVQNPVRVALSCFKGGKEEVVGKNRQQTKEPRMWSNSMQSPLLHYWQTAQTDGSEMF